MNPTLVPTEVAAAACGVKPGTIRLWVHRGYLTRYGTAKKALVDLTECEHRAQRKVA